MMFRQERFCNMIEVLFGESEAASMKAAKCRISVNKTVPPSGEVSGWIEGNANEVICLGFMLDMGDITEPADSLYRREFLYSLYAVSQWDDEEVQNEMKNIGTFYAGELRRLESFLDQGETVRIWYSDAPYSRCGLYHLCRMLERYENEIRVVKLPDHMALNHRIIYCGSWGEAAPEQFAGFLSSEQILSGDEVHYYACLWEELVTGNSPLRAVINGRVTGVLEDFYDFQIWNLLSDRPVKEARLIGEILGIYRMGIGDWWYARRIEFHIRQGNIRVVEDSRKHYARVICRVKS